MISPDSSIVCAAIKSYKTGKIYLGRRHSDCIWVMNRLEKFSDIDQQGFIDSQERFFDRETAGRIAFQRGQIRSLPEEIHPGDKDLYSEDLY